MKKYKLRVTPEESKEVQQILFKLGYKWANDTRKISHTDMPYLFLNSHYHMQITNGDNKRYFNIHKAIEITSKVIKVWDTKLYKLMNE